MQIDLSREVEKGTQLEFTASYLNSDLVGEDSSVKYCNGKGALS